HVNDNKIAIEKILAEGLSTFFVNYLNEDTLLRLVDTFCLEGYKVLFRVGLALFKHAQQALLQTKFVSTLCYIYNFKDNVYTQINQFRAALIKESKKLHQVDLCKLAKEIKISRDKFEKLETLHQETLMPSSLENEEEVARRWPSWDPEWIKQSNILKHKGDFLQLWVWLPPQCHVGDFEMLFSTAQDGYKLSTLYEK
ncbi:hypothetical protein RFI_20355, partial [Reticulomyxa filosa]